VGDVLGVLMRPADTFTGDLFHSPLQVIEPHWASCYDEETRAAEASRRRVLSLAADTAALVLPAHLPGAQNCTHRRPCRAQTRPPADPSRFRR
jgi:hypothetical protein